MGPCEIYFAQGRLTLHDCYRFVDMFIRLLQFQWHGPEPTDSDDLRYKRNIREPLSPSKASPWAAFCVMR
jgi:hypothetical protein